MIPRLISQRVQTLAQMFKCIAVTGPRQAGKTTLVKSLFKDKPYVSLENLDTRNYALNDPRGFLDQYPTGVVLDEIQRVPELFSYLQEYIDNTQEKGKYILSGSNNFLLQQSITQSLAGRVAYIDLLPFGYSELENSGNSLDSDNEYLFKGAYPPIYDQQLAPEEWYPQYIRTYIERDVRQLKNIGNLIDFERFMRLLAGRNGQELNKASLGVEAGVDAKTIDAWISVLETSYLVFLVPPFYKNYNKVLVKRPRVYFYDTGLVCNLLGIYDAIQLDHHPLRGAIFEGMMVSELYKMYSYEGSKVKLYYWRDKTGHEIDVIIDKGNKVIPIEIKASKTIQENFFKGIKYWNTLRNDTQGIVLYAGEVEQVRTGNLRIENWKNFLRKH
jgi:uncharacterized protein